MVDDLRDLPERGAYREVEAILRHVEVNVQPVVQDRSYLIQG